MNLMEIHKIKGILHTTLPDSDITVLVVKQDIEYPVWPGYHDGDDWRTAEGDLIAEPVLGWADLYELAAFLIDALDDSKVPGDPKKDAHSILKGFFLLGL